MVASASERLSELQPVIRWKKVAFAATIFLSAFLLFQIELIISDYVLPWFGGSAAVWTTTMLVFQTLLFAAYLYAHAISRRLSLRSQREMQYLLIALSLAGILLAALRWPSPVTPGVAWKPGDPDHPVLRLMSILFVSVGLPFFLLSTTGPLMQAWYLRATHRSPYRLYAISNVGSLLGLLSYPFIVEPLLRLRARGWAWSASYLLFAAGVVICAAATRGATNAAGAVEHSQSESRPSWKPALLWILLPACGCVALLAGTSFITLYIASVPLIWVVPMALYLLSFIIAFGKPSWYQPGLFHGLYATGCIGLLLAIASADVWFELGACLFLVFVLCMVCHGEVVRLRPSPEHLTTFYLCISGGGALGGIFVGIIAPQLSSRPMEFQASIIATGALVIITLYRNKHSWLYKAPQWAVIGGAVVFVAFPLLAARMSAGIASSFHQMQYFQVSALLCVPVVPMIGMFVMKPKEGFPTVPVAGLLVALVLLLGFGFYRVPWANNGTTVARIRNFYGVLEVQQSPQETVLMHGKTVHGSQWRSPAMRQVPTTYYGTDSGIGQLMLYHPKRNPMSPMRIGVVGMGAGTLAAYGVPGDYIRFYELNPGVDQLVRGKDSWFSFVNDSSAQVDVVLGDGRISLERELREGHPQNFDVLVLDAFNGDAVPVHLLTEEAIRMYFKHIVPDGVLAAHVSSTTVDLSPVLLASEQQLHLAGIVTNLNDRRSNITSTWIFLSRNPESLRTRGLSRYGQPLDLGRRPVLWTDDYTNIASLPYR